MLPIKYRLKKRTEFAYSYKHGKCNNFKYFNIVIFKRKDKLLRIGFSVSKKIGKAFRRNKVKRQLRAIVFENLLQLPVGYNLIFIAKPEINEIDFKNIKTEINKSLEKCLLK